MTTAPAGEQRAGSTPSSVVDDGRLTSIAGLLDRTDDTIRRGEIPGAAVLPTGFGVLDDALAGGFRSGELVLLGGPQGLGKTTMAMQMVRNVVHAGGHAVVFSYEHEAHTLLERLMSLEAAEVAGYDAARLHTIRRTLEQGAVAGSLDERLSRLTGVSEGLRTVRGYAERLYVHESNGATTDLAEIERVVARLRAAAGAPVLVLVDYLQKVPVAGGPAQEEERVTVVVERLKDLSLDLGVPVLAIVAADKASLVAGRRMRVHDLRGSSALAYEADVVLILNDKYDVVARHHLVYDLGNADRYKAWVVMTLEKNRHGVDKVELEFQKRFEEGRFEAHGQYVMEQLIEERVFTE
jgi:replicative DNA helicase